MDFKQDKLWLLIASISVIGLLTILNLHFSLQITQQIKGLEAVNQQLFAKIEKKDLSELIPAILNNQQNIYAKCQGQAIIPAQP